METRSHTFVLLATLSLFGLPLLVAASDAEARLAKIEATLEKVLENNEQLERRVAVLEEENGALKEVVLGMVRETPAEQDTGSDQEQPGQDSKAAGIVQTRHVPLQLKRQFGAETFAFTAVVSPATINVAAGQTVVYDKVITNVGGAYDPSSGFFTAPVSGVFTFNFAEMIDAGQNEYLELVKEGQHVMWNFGHASGASHLVSSSRTTTLEVQRGERVWVRTRPNAAIHGTGHVHGNAFTTFSGWIIAYSE